MDLSSWHEALRLRVKSLYTTMRVLYGQVAEAGTFLVSATSLGGQHGYDEDGATAPLGGAVTGFTKTYKRERMNALVKAVDFEAGQKRSEIAEILIEETLRDPGAVEVGYKEGLRWSVGLQEQPTGDDKAASERDLALDKNTVFLVRARPEASYRRSPPIWQRHREVLSICSIWCPSLIRRIPTCSALSRTRTG